MPSESGNQKSETAIHRSPDGELIVRVETDAFAGVVTLSWENLSSAGWVDGFRFITGVPPRAAPPNAMYGSTQIVGSGERRGSRQDRGIHRGGTSYYAFQTREDYPWWRQLLENAPETRYSRLVTFDVWMPVEPNREEIQRLKDKQDLATQQIALEQRRKELQALTELESPPDAVGQYEAAIETDLRLMQTMDHVQDRLLRYIEAKRAEIAADKTLSTDLRERKLRSLEIHLRRFTDKHEL